MTTIKLRRGLSTAFSTNNPVLAAGEPAFATDTGILKIGDGTTAYNSLPSIGASPDSSNYVTTNTAQTISGSKTFSANQNIGSITINGDSPTIKPTGTMTFRRNASSSASDTLGIRFEAADNTNGGVACGVHSASSSKGGLLLYTRNNSPYRYFPSIMFSPYGTPDSLSADITCYNNTAINVRAATVNIGAQTPGTSGSYTGLRVKGDGTLLEYNNNSVLTSASVDSTTITYDSTTGKISAAGANVDLSNTTDQAKILMSGMGMPSSKYIELTPGASGSTYTAPANGYFQLAVLNGTLIQFYNNTKTQFWKASTSTGKAFAESIECQAGDVIQCYYEYTALRWFRFYYAQGSESEAQ